MGNDHTLANAILLENYPYTCWDTGASARADEELLDWVLVDGMKNHFDALSFQPIDRRPTEHDYNMMRPRDFEYLIDGQWKTFDEVMA
jgi:hypothetical protein